jgi:putative membrane protein
MKNSLITLSVSALMAMVSCGPNTKQQDDNYKSADANVAVQQTPSQSAEVSTDSTTGKHIAEGQTGERSGSGGLPGQSVGDREFITTEIDANAEEIKVAELAAQHSTDNGIKSLAATMIKDHNEAIAQLRKLATDKGLKTAGKATTGVNDLVKKASNKTGEQFNREWLQIMIALHKKTISAYEAMTGNSADPDLKTWITGILPKLKMHLSMLTDAQKRLNV